MSTHVPGFQSFLGVVFLHHFVLAKLVNSSMRVEHTSSNSVIFEKYLNGNNNFHSNIPQNVGLFSQYNVHMS